jgi:hypothetical protein
MNILFACTSTNNVATMWGSLQMLGDHSVVVFPYDRKYYEALGQVRQTNPGEYDAICKGQLAWNPSRDRIAMDRELIMECKIGKPDVIVYVSAWQGPFVPLNDTIEEMNKIAPVIHLLNDGQDPPWFKGDENRPGQLYEFDRRGQFSLTVNIDGGRRWPGGDDWNEDLQREYGPPLKGKCMTLLTPLDLVHYRNTGLAFGERPYSIGYSGSPSSPTRAAIINRLQRVQGFNYRPRDETGKPNSYAEHIGFLQYTQVSVNVPFTGSGVERQVKGRVLEAGFAGCCCLEWQSSTIESWFTPRLHYWPYSSVEECAEMAEWISHHPKIAEDIGRAMKAELEAKHHPRVFWETVFGAIGK